MKYLVELESGKNNIAGCDLRIERGSTIVDAKDETEAVELAMDKLDLKHYGHWPDFRVVKSIKKLEL